MFVWKKYVYEVYKERSFTKAAQNLYISQPSLSARIKKIEEIIGEPLYDKERTHYDYRVISSFGLVGKPGHAVLVGLALVWNIRTAKSSYLMKELELI